MSHQWQYKMSTIKREFLGLKMEKIEETLNKLGAQGWELVCTDEMNGDKVLYLKKPG